jgi:hypothetical protein
MATRSPPLAPPNPTALWLADRTVINEVVLAPDHTAHNRRS